MFDIKPATREQAPITAAIIGGSGHGKTYSALLFARGLVGPSGKIVVIDSEGGRSKIYADDPDIGGFDHLDLIEPYTSERFRSAFKEAVAFGADAIVIDTISHEHEGFLEYAEQEEKRMSNSRAASRNKWIKPKAGRKRFYSAISSSHAHVIATIRLNRIVNMDVKPAIEIMKPECDKDFPYRLDLSVQVNPDHTTKIIKVPKPLAGIINDGELLSIRHGQLLAQDNDSQEKPDQELKLMIVNLEVSAEQGSDALAKTYRELWRSNGPAGNAGELKEITPNRAHMQKHLERLKGLASAADDLIAKAGDDPSDISEPDSGGHDDGDLTNGRKSDE